MNTSTKFCNISITENRGLKHITLLFVKCNCLISTEMRYKPCFNEYNGIKEVIKLYNRNIKRSQSFLYNVLDNTEKFL